jgi:hypothetical protein
MGFSFMALQAQAHQRSLCFLSATSTWMGVKCFHQADEGGPICRKSASNKLWTICVADKSLHSFSTKT